MNGLQSRTERNIGWLVLAILLFGCALVLRPFVSSLLWAVVLCFSSWPIYRRLLRLLGNHRTLASLTMTIGLIVVLLVPFFIIGLTLADNVKELTVVIKRSIEGGPPDPPAWLVRVPLVG